MTAYKFQPASNNPYLQLTQADNDREGGGEEEEEEEFIAMHDIPNTVELSDIDDDDNNNNNNLQNNNQNRRNRNHIQNDTDIILDLNNKHIFSRV
jgi:hypothetical protein